MVKNGSRRCPFQCRLILGPCAWSANGPHNRVYLLNGDDIEQIGMREAQIGLKFSRPSRVNSYRLTFLRLSSLSAVKIVLMARILPLPTVATIEEKTTFVRTEAIPRSIDDHRLFQKIYIHESSRTIINTDGEEETGKSRILRGH